MHETCTYIHWNCIPLNIGCCINISYQSLKQAYVFCVGSPNMCVNCILMTYPMLECKGIPRTCTLVIPCRKMILNTAPTTACKQYGLHCTWHDPKWLVVWRMFILLRTKLPTVYFYWRDKWTISVVTLFGDISACLSAKVLPRTWTCTLVIPHRKMILNTVPTTACKQYGLHCTLRDPKLLVPQFEYPTVNGWLCGEYIWKNQCEIIKVII